MLRNQIKERQPGERNSTGTLPREEPREERPRIEKRAFAKGDPRSVPALTIGESADYIKKRGRVEMGKRKRRKTELL